MKLIVNTLTYPPLLLTICLIVFAALMISSRLRTLFISKGIGWFLFLVFPIIYILCLQDSNFRNIGTKPDNLAILLLAWVTPLSLWLFLRMAWLNDQRISAGQPVEEAQKSAQLLTWPHLLSRELAAVLLISGLLIIWSIIFKAPLETPADPATSPNPAKAPWYFLGLQELLVYFDPWFAGVLLPFLAVTGLMLIPFLDKNPMGKGYYTFKQRPCAVSLFLFAWIFLWVIPILIGTFLRGPNWNFFGPFEPWDINKMPVLANLNLSTWVFETLFRRPPPLNPFFREGPGLLILAGYCSALPFILGATVFKNLLKNIGKARYTVFMVYMLILLLVPMKMILRWIFNLKYLIFIPELNLNL
jgi:hypothetical protein